MWFFIFLPLLTTLLLPSFLFRDADPVSLLGVEKSPLLLFEGDGLSAKTTLLCLFSLLGDRLAERGDGVLVARSSCSRASGL